MDDTTASGEPDTIPTVLELDHVFEALAHPRRRYVLYTLLENDEWTLRTLARNLTAWEKDVSTTSVTADETDRTYVSLYHSHVPKLVDDDIVEFDEVNETITRGTNAAVVLAVLENVGGVRDSKQEEHARRGYDEGLS